MLQVEVCPAAPEDKEVVGRLLELYLYDLSELTGDDVGSQGWFGYRYLDEYWTEPGWHPFIVRVDTRLAGLALVRSGTPHDIAEFFVMRKYRRQGVGRRVACALFDMFPGEWQVRQHASNAAATAFWRSVIPVPFRDDTGEIGPIQRFHIGPR